MIDDIATGDPLRPLIDKAIAQSKAEILDDIAEGIVPTDVATFSDLHSHVDANMYGGVCDDDREWPWGTDADPNFYVNAVQYAVDAWLRTGRPTS